MIKIVINSYDTADNDDDDSNFKWYNIDDDKDTD